MRHHDNFALFVGNDEQVVKKRTSLGIKPEEKMQRQFQPNFWRDIDESTRVHQCGMQGDEFRFVWRDELV